MLTVPEFRRIVLGPDTRMRCSQLLPFARAFAKNSRPSPVTAGFLKVPGNVARGASELWQVKHQSEEGS